MAVKQVQGIRIGDPVYYKEVRYKVVFFYTNRTTVIILKTEENQKESPIRATVHIKEIESVY